MKISDLLKLSTDNLRRRKGRTALTVIGVVVGTCAIIVMISLGIAQNQRTDAMLESWSDLTLRAWMFPPLNLWASSLSAAVIFRASSLAKTKYP